MVRISEAARITSREAGDAETVEERSWLVWRALRGKCDKKGTRKSNADTVPGFQITISVQSVCFSLWPELQQKDELLRTEFTRPIYEYLRATGNAVCVVPRPEAGHGPVWWVRDTFNSVAVLSEWRAGRRHATAAEDRVTPEEAGETREPAPVTTTVATTNGANAMTAEPSAVGGYAGMSAATRRKIEEAFAASRQKRSDEHQALVEAVGGLLEEIEEPVVIPEIAHFFEVTDGTIRGVLRELGSEGKAFSRVESADERKTRAGGTFKARRATLWWHTSDVPPRVTREIITGYVAAPTPRTGTGPIRAAINDWIDKRDDPTAWFIRSSMMSYLERKTFDRKALKRELKAMIEEGVLEAKIDNAQSHYRRIAGTVARGRPEPTPLVSDELVFTAVSEGSRSLTQIVKRLALSRDGSGGKWHEKVAECVNNLERAGRVTVTRRPPPKGWTITVAENDGPQAAPAPPAQPAASGTMSALDAALAGLRAAIVETVDASTADLRAENERLKRERVEEREALKRLFKDDA